MLTNGPLAIGLMSDHMSTRDYIDPAREQGDEAIERRGCRMCSGLKVLEDAGALSDPDLKVSEKI